MHEFVTNEAIWQRIKSALDDEKPARIAVPFIGLGVSSWIKPPADSWILTRCDLKSAQAGQVSGKDLLKWHKNGVRIFNLQALHAKVFAFERAVFIGSSNASVTSRDRLIEAGVWSTERVLAKDAWDFVESHCNEEVDEKFLEKLAEAYRPPTQFPLHSENEAAKGGRALAKRASRLQDEAPLHLIRLYHVNWNEAQQAAVGRAEANGRKRLEGSFKGELNSFTWPGAPGRFAVGDLVLPRMTYRGKGGDMVQPWARVVGMHKVRGKDEHAVTTVTMPSWKSMKLSEFIGATGGMLDAFVKKGGRSRLATPEERAMVLTIWSHRRAKLTVGKNKTSRA